MNRGTPKGLDSLWKAIKGMSSSSKIHTIVARVEPSWCKTLQPSCCKGKLGVYVSTTKRSNSGFWRLIYNGIPNGLQDLSDFKPARKKKQLQMICVLRATQFPSPWFCSTPSSKTNQNASAAFPPYNSVSCWPFNKQVLMPAICLVQMFQEVIKLPPP